MNNEILFNENVSRINKGKKRSIGGVLTLNEKRAGRLMYIRQSDIIRFHIKAVSDSLSLDQSGSYTGAIPMNPEANESKQYETINFAITFGDGENAGASLNTNGSYYYFSPKDNGYLMLYFDALMQKNSTDEFKVISFVIVVNSDISKKEVFFWNTDNPAVAPILYDLVLHYKRWYYG